MSVSITIQAEGFDAALRRLDPIFDFEPAALMEIVGATAESQTRRRITDEKTSPDGEAWLPNQTGTSILHDTGRNLLDSVASTSSADEAQAGAAWEHAHVHQFGMVIEAKDKALAFPVGGGTAFARKVTIPARAFVGLSADNADEIEEVVTDFLGLAA